MPRGSDDPLDAMRLPQLEFEIQSSPPRHENAHVLATRPRPEKPNDSPNTDKQNMALTSTTRDAQMNSHVRGNLVWFEAIVTSFWERQDALFIGLEDGTSRRMNRENWEETYEITRHQMLDIVPGRTFMIATWGGYDEHKWFCDLKPVQSTLASGSALAPWATAITNRSQPSRLNITGSPASSRFGVTKYMLGINLVKGEPDKGVWQYSVEHESMDQRILTFTRQKMIQSVNKSQSWHAGPCHDVRPEDILKGAAPKLLNVVIELEKKYFSQL